MERERQNRVDPVATKSVVTRPLYQGPQSGQAMASLSKPVPLWSLFLVLLVGIGSTAAAFTAGPQIPGLLSRKEGNFSVTESPPVVALQPGSSSTSSVTLTSIDGFAGTVGVAVTVSPTVANGPTIATSPTAVALTSSGGQGSIVVTISTTDSTPPGNYTVTLLGTNGGLSHAVSVVATVTSPIIRTGTEALNAEAYAFPNSTSLSLDIRDTGTSSVSLVTYYVKDSAGNTYSLTQWSGPTISPSAVAVVSVNIGASCSACTLSGTAFTFNAGNSYTITVVTSRNNQFIFTVIR